MRVFILITLLAIGNVFTLVSATNNKIEIGRVESIQKVNVSNTVDSEKEKDVYYVESGMKSNNKGI
jgi:hypothetical protein